jgi:hypothetical protein
MAARDKATARKKAKSAGERKKHKVANARSKKAKFKNAYRST